MRTVLKRRAGSLRVVHHDLGPAYLVLLTQQADPSTNGVYELRGDFSGATIANGGLRRAKGCGDTWGLISCVYGTRQATGAAADT